MIHHGHARVDKGSEPLCDAFGIVIGAPRGFAPLEEPGLHDILGTVEEEGEGGWANGGFEMEGLIHFTGEAWMVVVRTRLLCCVVDLSLREGKGKRERGCTIDEKSPRAAVSFNFLSHGVFKELHCDFHGNDLSRADIFFDHAAEFTVRSILLCAEEIPRAQMDEAVIAHEIGALGSFSRAGAAEDEDDGDRGRVKSWGCFGRSGH